MLPFALAASLVLASVYPADAASSASPLGRYAVANVELDHDTASGHRHVLYLVDRRAQSKTVLAEYAAGADVSWSPDLSAVAVSDHPATGDADVVVYEIEAGKVARKVSLLSTLAAAPGLGKELKRYGQRRLEFVQWRPQGRLDCRLRAQDGASVVERHVLVGLAGQVQEVTGPPPASRAKPSKRRGAAPEWRLPSRAELSEAWRDRDEDRFSAVRGDFDGDGEPDEARLVVSRDETRVAVRVTLSSSRRPQVVGAVPQSGTWHPILSVGLHLRKPGRYRTACGKDQLECEGGEGAEVVLAHDGIELFQEASAYSVFYLPAGKMAKARAGRRAGGEPELHRVWMSN